MISRKQRKSQSLVCLIKGNVRLNFSSFAKAEAFAAKSKGWKFNVFNAYSVSRISF